MLDPGMNDILTGFIWIDNMSFSCCSEKGSMMENTKIHASGKFEEEIWISQEICISIVGVPGHLSFIDWYKVIATEWKKDRIYIKKHNEGEIKLYRLM